MAVIKRLQKKADKASTRVGRVWFSKLVLSAYFRLISSILEAVNTNLFVIICSFVWLMLGLNPERFRGGKSEADTNSGATNFFSPRAMADHIFTNVKTEKASPILWERHTPIPIPPQSKMLNWIPRGNSSASYISNGSNLLSSQGTGFFMKSESWHLTRASRKGMPSSLQSTNS